MTGNPFPDLPADRPEGLDVRPSRHGRWWRFDRHDPRTWSWVAHRRALHRFDPLTGRFRVRYAASSLLGATLERFSSHGRRRVTDADADIVVCRLSGRPDTVDLTDRVTRALLHVDERISIGRAQPGRPDGQDQFLDVCGRMADLVHDWEGIPPTTIMYRSRHDAARANLAFGTATLAVDTTPQTLGRSRDAITALLAAGVSVPHAWIEQLDR